MRLIAVDIDGTFVDRDNHYDVALFRQLYQRMQQKQIHFVVASGNQYPHLARLFPRDLQDHLDYVAENGALVMSQGQQLFCSGLTYELTKRTIDRIHEIPHAQYVISTLAGGLVPSNATDTFKKETDHYYAIWDEFSDFKTLAAQEILKLTIKVPDAQVPEVEEIFASWPELSVTSSGFGYLDVINPNLHKAHGLKVLSQHYQISPKDMVVFGDSANDLEMFDYAGQAYAMANAEPILKKATPLRAPSNEDNGVLQVMQKLLA